MEIRIRKASAHCLACGKKFEHLEKHFSRVNVPDEHELVREDYCPACWQNGRAADIEKTYSFWLSKYVDSTALSQPQEREFSPLLTIFQEAADKEERTEQAIAYLAAHLLRRQKVFRFVKRMSDEAEREGDITIFSDRFTGQLVEVNDPGLSVEELNEARRELVRRLEQMEGTQHES